MGITKFESINAKNARARMVTVLPTAPYQYYDTASNDVDSVEWSGGELCLLYTDSYHGRIYIQTSTSGKTAIWIRLLEQLATTTSSSTSSSSSSSTSSSTSSTSSSSSTSTSTSTSSSSSSSTSSSSTTTA